MKNRIDKLLSFKKVVGHGNVTNIFTPHAVKLSHAVNSEYWYARVSPRDVYSAYAMAYSTSGPEEALQALLRVIQKDLKELMKCV